MWENMGYFDDSKRKNVLLLLSCKHNHSVHCVKETVSSIQAISIFSPCIKLGHSRCTCFRLYQLLQVDFSFIAGLFISLTEIMGFIVPHSGCFMYRVLVLLQILLAFRQKTSSTLKFITLDICVIWKTPAQDYTQCMLAELGGCGEGFSITSMSYSGNTIVMPSQVGYSPSIGERDYE